MSTVARTGWPSISIVAALLLRLALFNGTSLPAALSRRIELSTPLTGIRYLNDGVYIYKSGLNPYECGNFHHSPLYLLLFSLFPFATSRISASILFTLSDYLAAISLRRIWIGRKWQEEATLKKRNDGRANVSRRWLRDNWEDGVMLLYLLNPYTIASCIAQSTTSIDNALILLAVAAAAQGQSPLTAFFLSLATHTSLYPILLLAPLLLLLVHTGPPGKTSWRDVVGTVFFFAGFFLAETAIAFELVGDWSWISWTWGSTLTVSDLTPNVGLNWYFFTEMFDHFRSFFVGTFQMHIAIYVAPLCIRLHDHPLLAVTVLGGIISIFKSYPTLGDASLWLGLLGCLPDIWADLRHPLLSVALQLYSVILLPILHSLWLESGTGNANFFYAATLVYSLGCGMALVDILGAGLRQQAARTMIDEGILDEGDDGITNQMPAGRSEEIRSTKAILEDHDLVVVQYAGLGS